MKRIIRNRSTKFDELASLKNGMSVEWLIDRMANQNRKRGRKHEVIRIRQEIFQKVRIS